MEDGKLMYVAYMGGQAMGQPVETVKNDNGYVAQIQSEFGPMTMTFIPDGDNFKGTLDTGEFSMSFTMTPVKQ